MAFGSYTFADFVPFDEAAWQSLYTQYLAHNLWVCATLALLLAIALMRGLRLAPDPARRSHCSGFWPATLVLAACWGWLGWEFHRLWHQQLNWAAHYWVAAFLLQGILLLGLSLALQRRVVVVHLNPVNMTCLLAPWLIPPLGGWLIGGRRPESWEFVASAPDPTIWLTLVLLLTLRVSAVENKLLRTCVAVYTIALLVLPTLSLLVSIGVAWTISAMDLLATQTAAILCVLVMLLERARSRLEI